MSLERKAWSSAGAVGEGEGNTDVAGKPLAAEGSSRRAHRGPRAGHVRKGSPGTWEAPSPPEGALTASVGAVPPSEETKRGGKGDEASEHFVVADEAGEPSRGTPWREGRAGAWICWGER